MEEEREMAVILENILKQQIQNSEMLGGLIATADGIREHLRMLNGTTARTVDRVTMLEGTVKAHPGFCEVRSMVAELGKGLAVLQTESAGREAVKIERREVEAENAKDNQPYKWLFFLILAALILSHGKDLLGVIGVK